MAVAQLVEQLTFDPEFKGSKPVMLALRGNRGNKKKSFLRFVGGSCKSGRTIDSDSGFVGLNPSIASAKRK